MLDGAPQKSPPIRTDILKDAPSSSDASAMGVGAVRRAPGRFPEASLGDEDLDRLDDEITMQLSIQERLELCFDLSDFCAELNDAARRCRPVRHRPRSRYRA